MKTPYIVALAAALALTAQALQARDQDTVNQAASTIERFKTIPEVEIPPAVLRDAKGLAILTVVKGGFIWSGRFGDGVVVARVGSGWSGPSFIRTAGIGFGAQIGGEVTEFVLVLNTPDAVKAFAEGANVQLGGALSAAAGPMGRSAEAGVLPKAAVYAYSRSQGLFAGVSLEGTVIQTNKDANARYYRAPVGARAILTGRVAPPPGASVLLSRL